MRQDGEMGGVKYVIGSHRRKRCFPTPAIGVSYVVGFALDCSLASPPKTADWDWARIAWYPNQAHRQARTGLQEAEWEADLGRQD